MTNLNDEDALFVTKLADRSCSWTENRRLDRHDVPKAEMTNGSKREHNDWGCLCEL